MDEERRTEKRRADDHRAVGELTTRLKRLEELREQDLLLHEAALNALQSQLMEELRAIRAQNEVQLEIMSAWNNAKGFVKGVQLIGRVTKWLAGFVAAVGAIWALLHYGGLK